MYCIESLTAGIANLILGNSFIVVYQFKLGKTFKFKICRLTTRLSIWNSLYMSQLVEL